MLSAQSIGLLLLGLVGLVLGQGTVYPEFLKPSPPMYHTECGPLLGSHGVENRLCNQQQYLNSTAKQSADLIFVQAGTYPNITIYVHSQLTCLRIVAGGMVRFRDSPSLVVCGGPANSSDPRWPVEPNNPFATNCVRGATPAYTELVFPNEGIYSLRIANASYPFGERDHPFEYYDTQYASPPGPTPPVATDTDPQRCRHFGRRSSL